MLQYNHKWKLKVLKMKLIAETAVIANAKEQNYKP